MINRGLSLICKILIPGAGYIYAQRPVMGFAVPIIGILWVALISFSGVIFEIRGFIALLSGLISIHLISLLHSHYLTDKIVKPRGRSYIWVSLLALFVVSIMVYSHKYKHLVFGFSFYHIPSDSMSPNLLPGDIIMVNTRYKDFRANDIFIGKRSNRGIVLAKRVKETRLAKNGQTELYLVGDNVNKSTDSRSFGWVNGRYAIGRATFVAFSLRNKSRLLKAL